MVVKWELAVYFIVWCASLGYSCYSVFLTSSEYKDDLNPHLFEPGWSVIGRNKDWSDYEWAFFYGWFWKVLPWYLAYTVSSQLIHWLLPQYRSAFSLSFSTMALFFLMGWVPLVIIGTHCAISYRSTLRGSVVVWITCLGLLSSLNFEPMLSFMKVGLVDDDFYLLLFTVSLCNLRYTSFCLEKAWASNSVKPNGNPNSAQIVYQTLVSMRGYQLVDLLVYVSYLPLFFTGPILTYNLFRQQRYHPLPSWTLQRIWNSLRELLRILFWAFFNELLLHYFYFHSLQQNLQIMKEIPLWSLAGIGYLHGQFFMVKYVVMFGFPAWLASVDGLKPPEGPKCISRISNYSDMWKYFDQGLYSFIKRYIYVPLGGSRNGLCRQLMGSAVIFLYVFYWHGAENYLFLWAVLNYLGITLELLGKKIAHLQSVQAFEEKWLSSGLRCRLHALLTAPLFIMSSLSIFVFFGGTETGMIFYERLLIKGWPTSSLLILLVYYCGVHVCSAVADRERQRVKVKKL